VAIEVNCPLCGEDNDLQGVRTERDITVTCGACGASWTRSLQPSCDRCGGDDLQTVPVAVVEKGRGTQLSVVGIRMIQMCWTCDIESIQKWQQNRPNPLLPDELPTVSPNEP
jgi:hypothetical protein